jgi:hypothetical protein
MLAAGPGRRSTTRRVPASVAVARPQLVAGGSVTGGDVEPIVPAAVVSDDRLRRGAVGESGVERYRAAAAAVRAPQRAGCEVERLARRREPVGAQGTGVEQRGACRGAVALPQASLRRQITGAVPGRQVAGRDAPRLGGERGDVAGDVDAPQLDARVVARRRHAIAGHQQEVIAERGARTHASPVERRRVGAGRDVCGQARAGLGAVAAPGLAPPCGPSKAAKATPPATGVTWVGQFHSVQEDH